MSYSSNYTITTLSGNVEQYNTPFLAAQAPFIPTGRIRQPIGGAPYTAINGTIKKFPLGKICYNGDWVPGKIGNYALDFDGTNDYIIAGDALDRDWGWMSGHGGVATFTWSVSFWMKYNEAPSGINAVEELFTTYVTYFPYAGITFYFTDTGGYTRALAYRLDATGGGGAGPKITDTLYPDDTNWHHIAVTMDRDAQVLKFYVDGTATTHTSVAGGVDEATGPLVLGMDADLSGLNRPFSGQMDDFAIWNVVLTAAEITELYNNGIGRPANSVQASNIVSYWNFEDGPGSSTLKNMPTAASGSLNGTLTNMDAGTACEFPVKKPW